MIHIDLNNLSSADMIEVKRIKKLNKKVLIEKSGHFLKYRKEILDEAFERLTELYMNKCGYCETNPIPGSDLERDHYRPRGKLNDDESHPGYYWLVYEWTNLVPACRICNNTKLNRFPIDASKGKRVSEPPMDNGSLDMEACRVDSEIHLAEEPLLLNPVVDKPENHLTFLPDGNVESKSQKGKTTIEICKLDRDELIYARKGLINLYFNALTIPLKLFIERDISKETLLYFLDNVFKEMEQARSPENEYSRLGWFLFEKFEMFFIQRFKAAGDTKSARVLEKAFSKFRQHGTCRKKAKKGARPGFD